MLLAPIKFDDALQGAVSLGRQTIKTQNRGKQWLVRLSLSFGSM